MRLSITTRAARRASISHDKEYAHLRSCLRRPGSSPGPRPSSHHFFGNGPSTPPVLPPLVEDSPFLPEEALITSPVSEEPSPITPNPNPGESDERAPRSFARSRSLPASENGSIGAGAGGAMLAATRSLSPSSYFNFSRRRGGSLSSSLAEADSGPAALEAADSPHPPKPARSQSLGPSASPTTHDIPSPPASGSGTHYPLAHFHIPTIHSQSLSTVPLAPCCADCIATLDAHPSALLPLNSEDDAHWSKRAWEKRKADEAEEEAVRRSAGIAHGDADTAPPPAYQSMPASAPAVSPEEKKMMDHLESSPTTPSVRRTPLSPASIKRNQAFRNHFASKDSEVEECRGVKSEDEARRCLDVVDMGVKARVVPKREVKDDDEEEDEDEEEEREIEAAPSHISDFSDAKHKHDVENKTALALVGNPVVSLLPSFPSSSSTPTAPAASPSPAAAPSSPPEQGQTRGGFMTRLRSRSSSNPTPPTPAPSQSNVGPKGGIKTGGGETSGFNAFTALTRLSGVAS